MMHKKHSPPPRAKRCNGHYNRPPVELLSARIFRLRIARGYSVYDLAMAAHVFGGTIYRLESGKATDNRDLPALSRTLGVPLCYLVCAGHDRIARLSSAGVHSVIKHSGHFIQLDQPAVVTAAVANVVSKARR